MSETINEVVLRNAYDLLNSKMRWTTGAWARDARGKRCGPLSRHARQWCALGALQKCAYDLIGDEHAARKIADTISKKLVPGLGGLAFVNEWGGYALVRTVMRLGGPPPKAETTWPFPDFHTRLGFAAISRREFSAPYISAVCQWNGER